MITDFKESVQISGISDYYPNHSRTFKQFQVEMMLEVPSVKPDIEYILHDNINVLISDTYLIGNPCSRSHEGQILTGYKLIVNGEICQKVEYVADNCNQSVHAAEFTNKFSTFIVIDDNLCQSFSYKVTPYVEDVFIKQLDKRKLFKNVMLLLDATPINNELADSSSLELPIEYQRETFSKQNDNCSCSQHVNKYFSQFCCQDIMELPSQKPDIEQIISVIAEPEIISVKFIDTLKGISAEGQRLTGKKAILEIMFRQKLLYAADVYDQSVCGAESVCYKSAYIVLPLLLEGTEPEVLYKNNLLKFELKIEDIYSVMISKRTVFKNICIYAEALLIPTYELCYSICHSCSCSELFLCYADGSCSTPITKSKEYNNIKPAWSPDGSQIAYLQGRNESFMLYCFNIKNCARRIIIPEDKFDNISSFSWLTNSNQIIFSAAKNNCKELYIVSMLNNKYQQLTNGSGLIKSYYPKVSPSGCYVAYLRSSSCSIDLWYSDVLGKNPYKITFTGSVRDYCWLHDNSGFIYIDDKQDCCDINIIKFEEKQPRCIMQFDSIYGCKALTVSPDGIYLAFIATNKCSDDIYVYNILTDDLCNITNHSSSTKISSICWKTDSTKIYYSAKEFMSFDLYSIDILSTHKEHLTNTNSGYMQLNYRPKIK